MLTTSRLKEVLDYDPMSGVFTWKVRLSRRICVGDVAGSLRGDRIYITIDGKHYMAHRLAWLHVHGEWPADEIDHRDMNGRNNAIANLRLATSTQNKGNRKVRGDSHIGLKGASKNGARWQAKIKIHGQVICLGTYDTPEAAHAVYCAAATHHFGPFARHS